MRGRTGKAAARGHLNEMQTAFGWCNVKYGGVGRKRAETKERIRVLMKWIKGTHQRAPMKQHAPAG